MSYQELPPYPDPEMQAALCSLEFDPLPPAAPQVYPEREILASLNTPDWRHGA